jgi:hypothetical protein
VIKLKFWHSVSIVFISLLAMVLGLNLLWPFSHNLSVVEAAGPAYSGGTGNSLIQSLTATFSADHTVTSSITPSAAQTAGCTVSGTGTVSANATVNLQAHTVSGWAFSNWSSADITIANPAANPLTFTMPDKPVAVTATFAQTSHAVTASITPSAAQTAGCSVSGTGTVSANATVNLLANIVSGWTFKNWSSADITIANPAANPLTFTMPNKAVAVSAAFSSSTTTTVTSNVNPSTFGQAVTFTATVTAAGGITPTGTVTFIDGAATLGTGTLSAGSATYSTAALAAGVHSITAVYGGDSNSTNSTSTSYNQTVNAITYAVTAGISPSAAQTAGCSVSGTGNVTANATVSLQANIASGWMFMNWNSTDITITNTTANPLTFTMPNKPVAVTATFAISTLPGTTASVTSSVNPSTYGQTVTFTATVTAAGGPTPTGTVTFIDGAATLGTGALSSGIATLATSALAAGNHNITAAYGGDSNFSGSTSSIYSQVVNGGGVINPGPGPGGGGGSSAPTAITGVGSINVGNIVSAAGTFNQSATLTSSEGLATVSIPRGTTGTVNGLSLSTITVTPQTAPPSPSANFKLLGAAYDFGPNGATFNPPISLAFGYNPANIPAGIADNSLGIAFYDSAAGQWVALPGSVVNAEGYTITVQVSHFTYFAVVAVLPASSVPVSTPTPGSAASSTPTPTAAATPSVTSQPTPSSLAPTLTGTPVPSVTTPMASSTPKPVTTTASPLTSSAATPSPTPPINISLYIIIPIFIGVATVVVISLMVIRRRRL